MKCKISRHNFLLALLALIQLLFSTTSCSKKHGSVDHSNNLDSSKNSKEPRSEKKPVVDKEKNNFYGCFHAYNQISRNPVIDEHYYIQIDEDADWNDNLNTIEIIKYIHTKYIDPNFIDLGPGPFLRKISRVAYEVDIREESIELLRPIQQRFNMDLRFPLTALPEPEYIKAQYFDNDSFPMEVGQRLIFVSANNNPIGDSYFLTNKDGKTLIFTRASERKCGELSSMSIYLKRNPEKEARVCELFPTSMEQLLRIYKN